MNLWNPARGSLVLRLPLSWLFAVAISVRRFLYRNGLLKVVHLDVPVIVIGNITVGGSGKTPLTIWLVERLKEWGWQPGIASRGYGGEMQGPTQVDGNSDPVLVGDEPVMLARRTKRPVAVAIQRAQAAKVLIDAGCDIVVTDDGLQHYALARDLEIAMVDGARRFGNGRLLPAGPLREPLSRLDQVDLVVAKGRAQAGEYAMELTASCWRNVADPQVSRPANYFQGQVAHAVAGIAYPPSFFEAVRRLGIDVLEQPKPDHHRFTAADLEFGDTLPVLMTEKDAVKCREFSPEHAWYLEVEACFDTVFVAALRERLSRIRGEYANKTDTRGD